MMKFEFWRIINDIVPFKDGQRRKKGVAEVLEFATVFKILMFFHSISVTVETLNRNEWRYLSDYGCHSAPCAARSGVKHLVGAECCVLKNLTWS
jgi:hypothetical protein